MSACDQPPELIVYGCASHKTILHMQQIRHEDKKISLLAFLAQRSIKIASACNGKGLCQKCNVWFNSKKILACQQTLDSLSEALNGQNDSCRIVLTVDYL